MHSEVSLSAFNTFYVNERAAYLIHLHSTSVLPFVRDFVRREEIPFLCLGSGSNILFRNHFGGLVVHNQLYGWCVLNRTNEGVFVAVQSGEVLDNFIETCMQEQWYGLELLSGIPGTVGAGVAGNVGAYGKEIYTCVYAVQYFSFEDGCIHTLPHEAGRWAYRESIFNTLWRWKTMITSVIFFFPKVFSPIMTHKDICNYFNKHPPNDAAALREAVLAIRMRKLPHPGNMGSAGSFFKNPIISQEDLKRIQETSPDIPYFPVPFSDRVKISAAYLMEACGWKGHREKDVGCYDNHALILVSYASTRGVNIYNFANEIIVSVKERFGIELEPEVHII